MCVCVCVCARVCEFSSWLETAVESAQQKHSLSTKRTRFCSATCDSLENVVPIRSKFLHDLSSLGGSCGLSLVDVAGVSPQQRGALVSLRRLGHVSCREGWRLSPGGQRLFPGGSRPLPGRSRPLAAGFGLLGPLLQLPQRGSRHRKTHSFSQPVKDRGHRHHGSG